MLIWFIRLLTRAARTISFSGLIEQLHQHALHLEFPLLNLLNKLLKVFENQQEHFPAMIFLMIVVTDMAVKSYPSGVVSKAATCCSLAFFTSPYNLLKNLA